MKYLNYTIEYSGNNGDQYIMQANFHTIRKISFFNWDTPDILSMIDNAVVAIWKVKKLKNKPIVDMPPFITVFN